MEDLASILSVTGKIKDTSGFLFLCIKKSIVIAIPYVLNHMRAAMAAVRIICLLILFPGLSCMNASTSSAVWSQVH
jgi:hypothetical protein